MSAFHSTDHGLAGISFPVGRDGRPVVRPPMEPDFPSYVDGWWHRTRRLFWMSFFFGLVFCAMVNWIAERL